MARLFHLYLAGLSKDGGVVDLVWLNRGVFLKLGGLWHSVVVSVMYVKDVGSEVS
jgi:hypothetical protein